MAQRFLIAVMLCLALATARAQEDQHHWRPGIYESQAFICLGSASEYLYRLESEESELQRRILIRSGIDSLTVLYELHGCSWAGPLLANLYSHPDCPPVLAGYSNDGRIRVQIELLELKNPVFSEYSVLLITLESNTSLVLEGFSASPAVIETGSGLKTKALEVSPGQPLWDELERLSESFRPPQYLPPAAGISFKQLFRIVPGNIRDMNAVSFDWGEYNLRIEKIINQEHQTDG